MKKFTMQRSCIEETAYQLGVASASGDDPATVLLSDGACNEWTGAMASAVSVEEPPPVEPPPGGGGGGELPPGYSQLDLGLLVPNAESLVSQGFGAMQVAMATLVVPDMADGNQTIAVFEYGDPPTNRHAWLSKTPWDTSGMSPPYFLNNQGPVFNYSIGGTTAYRVNMNPGETWYLMVTNQKIFEPFEPSVQPGKTANIGIRWYPTHG